MKQRGHVLLTLLAVGILIWRFAPRRPEPSAGRDLPAKAPVPAGAVAAILSPPSLPLTPPRPPVTDPRSAPGPYAGYPVLSEERTPPDANGVFARLRLVEIPGKYPFLRIEDQFRPPRPGGAPVRVSRVVTVADHILVRLRDGASEDALQALNERYGGTIRRRMHRPQHYIIAFDAFDLHTVEARIAAYARHSLVTAFAEPDFVVRRADTVPNDPRFGELWGMQAIDCPAAWDITTGAGSVVVGIIDSGVNMNHEDLAANMWTNPGEIAGNNIDDDSNGFIDDIYGWDFAYSDFNPMDDDGHGSHTAGTVAGVGNNATGVVGVSWSTKIMALKFFDSLGNGLTTDAIDALHYTIMMRERGINIRVTNNSWGGGGYSQGLYDAIRDVGESGQLFMAAAGNYGGDNDVFPFFPASYNLSNIIAVAASHTNDALAGFSHFGATTVDLAAPGVSVLSSVINGYGRKDGTSMATPHVAGAAALLWEAYPEAAWSQVRAFLLAGVDPIASYAGKILSGGRLNVAGALNRVPPIITHTPLVNSTNAAAPYRVEATVVPNALLPPDRLQLRWNKTGSPAIFVIAQLTDAGNDVYYADIPAQPVGTEVFYYLNAQTAGGLVSTHPEGAPAALHSFAVVNPVTLEIDGSPQLGSVTPDYGTHAVPSGITVNASAELVAEATPQHRYRCTGWIGAGDAPGTGTTNRVSFRIAGASEVEWQWQSQYSLAQTSTPSGLVDTVTWWAAGTPAATLAAWPAADVAGTNYSFVEWLVDGTRRPDATNAAANPVSGVLMSTSHLAQAVYIPSDEDSDGDLLADWWERRYFGSLDADPDADDDDDTFFNDEEYADRTNPRDPTSVPTGPGVAHTPLTDPQAAPAPWTVSAVVTDNFSVAGVVLEWRRTPEGWNQLAMTNAGPDRYEADIPAPGLFGSSYEYRIEAADPGGHVTTNGPHGFAVAYPVSGISTSVISEVLRPDTLTNLLVGVVNTGNVDMTWSLRPGWRDRMERGTNGWVHGGQNERWHLSSYRAYSGAMSWYCGVESTREYLNSTDASLVMPPVRLGPNAELRFRHWPKMEYDADQHDDHYWDGAIVELSTNAGATFEQIAPIGGYPHRITDNPASPFAPNTPCYGGDGGWRSARFNLSSYSGRVVQVRFRFGSDAYVVEEGWYIDDVDILGGEMPPALWLSVLPANGVLAAGSNTSSTAGLDATGIATGDFQGFLELESNDPVTPTRDVDVTLLVRSPPEVAVTFAAQTATNGSGWVTVSNTVFDVDGDTGSLHVGYRAGTGAWHDAWIVGAEGSLTGLVVDSETVPQVGGVRTAIGETAATNTVTLTWDSTNAITPLVLSTATLVRVRAWDGYFWGGPATSAVFLVDNEAPTAVTAPGTPDYTPGSWATDRAVALYWQAAGDGAGVGVAGYAVDAVIGAGADVSPQVDTAATSTVAVVADDGTNWWFGVRAVDAYGNAGPAAFTGPVWIDSMPPDASGVVINFDTSPYGNYVVGSNVPARWSPAADNLSGVAGHYYAFSDGGTTSNGISTPGTNGTLSGAVLDATNHVFVWAEDTAGLIGSAVSAPILALSNATDYDGDGQSTRQETVAGTDAGSAVSRFEITRALNTSTGVSGELVLEWPGVADRFYSLFTRESLTATAETWQAVSGFTDVPGVDGTMSYTDHVQSVSERFYRLSVRD